MTNAVIASGSESTTPSRTSAYSTNYLNDLEHAIIVDLEATTAIRHAEVLAAKRMIGRLIDRFGPYPSDRHVLQRRFMR